MECDRMYGGISNLRDCLLQLEQGKVTERKDHIEKIKKILTRTDILQLLDKNTSRKRRKEDLDWRHSITWQKIFIRITKYINDEAERIRDREAATQNPTRIVLENRKKDKKSCCDFFKYIVKIIISRGQYTVCEKILDHIMGVMSDSFTLPAFGLDYTNVLLKEILSNTQTCLQIRILYYQNMIKLYIKLAKNPPQGWDRSTLMQVLYHLLLATYNQCDLKPQRLFEFFKTMFSCVKFEKASRYHEYLLKALILVSQNSAVSCRVQLCVLGESILSPLLQLWTTKPTDTIKELMLEFLLLQLTLHHPHGAVDEQSGAFIQDSCIWQSMLITLYYTIIKELNNVCEKNKYSIGKDLTLHPYFIAVSVEVCAQVFQDTYQSIEVTQMPSTFEATQVRKKRRVEVGFKVFIETIQSLPSCELIPWLHLMVAFLKKYPNIVSLGDIVLVISLLIEKHLSCKQNEVRTWLLTSCCAAVEAFCAIQKNDSSQNTGSVLCDWWRLWELGIRCVSLMHQCHEAGHKLLSTLLLNKLVTPKAEFYSLYCTGSNNKLSHASLTTLSIYMHNFPFPSIINSQHATGVKQSKDWFRYQLLLWLFATDDNDEMENFLNYLCDPHIDVQAVTLLASLLSCLCLQDYKPMIASCVSRLATSDIVSAPIEWINDLEKDLLHCTFDLPFTEYNQVSITYDSAPMSLLSSNLSTTLWEKITKHIETVSEKLEKNSNDLQISCDTHIVRIRLACLMFSMMKQLEKFGVLDNQFYSQPLTIDIKDLVTSILWLMNGKDVNQISAKDCNPKTECLTFLNIILNAAVQGSQTDNKPYDLTLTTWFYGLIPAGFENLILEALETNMHRKQQNISPSANRTTEMNLNQATIDDGSDDEFLCAGPSTSRPRNHSIEISFDDDDEFDMLDNDINHINSSVNGGADVNGQHSPEILKFKLQCVKSIENILKLKLLLKLPNFELSSSIKQFLKIVDSYMGDESKHTINSDDVSLTLKVLESVLTMPNLDLETVKHVLIAIEFLLNKHSKSRIICIDTINLLMSIYRHIFIPADCTSDNTFEKTHLLDLLQVLWEKEKDNKHAFDVSIALADALCSLIKQDDKIEWTSRRPDSDRKISEVSLLKKDTLSFFQHQHLKVRLSMASRLQQFFQGCSNNGSLSTEDQIKFLENTCKISIDHIKDSERQGQQAEGVLQDEKLNYGSSILHFLCDGYISSSDLCRKHILFMLFQFVKDSIISKTLAMKALLQIAKVLKYETVTDLVDHDILYVFHEWIKKKHSIKDFPWEVLKFSSCHEFFLMHYEKLVPLYVYHSDIQPIQLLAEILNIDMSEILVKCFPLVLARTFSWQIIDPESTATQHCISFLKENVPKETLPTSFEVFITDIFIALLRFLKEPPSTTITEIPSTSCACLSHISPPNFVSSIELFKTKIGVDGSFVEFLCSKQDSFQNILLSIHTQLSKSHMLDEQSHALLMYNVLFIYLESELENSLRNFIPFILTEFTYSLINFVVKNEPTMGNSSVLGESIKLIRKLCKCVLPISELDIGKLLPFIVSRLTPFVSKSSFGQQVFQLLTYLIVDCSEELEEYIILLDPFPDMEEFHNMRDTHKKLMYKNDSYTLEMEFDHFNKSFHATGRSTLEGIRHLHKQLREKQTDLFQIITDLQEKKLFSEDMKNSKLHQLIYTLVFLCTPGNADKEIQLEAGRCLGEIGPVDLSTIIFHVSHKEIDIMDEKEIRNSGFNPVYYNILRLLSDYLKESRLSIKTVTTDVLKNVFKTGAARQLVATYGGGSWLEYLYPFYSNNEADNTMDEIDEVLIDKVDQASLWVPNESEHSKWICDLVCTILESGITGNIFFQQLIPICKEEPAFCSQVLPYLIHAIALRNDMNFRPIISNHMSTFFSKLSQELVKQSVSLSSTPMTSSMNQIPFYASKASVQTMLSVVHYLRFQKSPWVPENVCSNSWTGLDLDYLVVAQAAQYCSAHFSAILYADLWWNSVREKNIAHTEDDGYSFESSQELNFGCSPMTIFNAQDEDNIALMHKIVLDAYSSIGDPDGIHGCIEIATDLQSVLLSHYTVEKKWNSLLNLYDTGDYNPGILKALKNCGLNHILKKYIESQTLLGGELSSQSIEYQYECAWRMNQWDEPLPESENPGFQECFYKSLDCLKSQNENEFLKQLENSRFIEFKNLSHMSLESLSCILPMLSHLQMLVMMEDYASVNFNSSSIADVSLKWEDQLKIPCADFEYQEPVSWLQCILLKQHLGFPACQDSTVRDYVKHLLQHGIRARQENYLEAASKAIVVLKNSKLENGYEMLEWQVEEAKILWAKQEQLVANHVLKSVLSSMEKIVEHCSGDKDLLINYATTLTLKGKWSGETCSENSTTIMQNYLQKAIDVLDKINSSKEELKTSDAYLAVARYADSQYQSIINYKNSIAYQSKQELMRSSKEHVESLKKKPHLADDLKKTILIVIRQISIDEQELKNIDVEQKIFLKKAVLGYLTCLRQTDAYDLWIFRLTALWFHNLNDKDVNQLIHDRVAAIEKYKFLPLMYQLAARMDSGHKQFSDVLNQLIRDIAFDHPHHALPIILSMSNADKDPFDIGTPVKKKDAGAEDNSRKERMAVAKKLISDLKKTKHRDLIHNLSELCDAYISLAYFHIEAKQRNGKIPTDQKIMKLKHLNNVPVITEVIKVDRSCKYSNVIGIQSFHPNFRHCGGINLPKVIKCIGMDGIEREQLVKGRDDLRQDAVMQQVFSLVNCLLKENHETNRRKLSIRTYKIVPMSRRSGVLQWCEGTQVLSQYLIGPNPVGGAHKKYYPTFWKNPDCQRKMKDIAAKPLVEKRKVFDEICKNYPPVFRYFFLENFPEPSAWFERKQCYTKSVATSSIVGYILGLGDRHVNNILVDKRTAEVVHIDFGIAFEKGKILSTPETVPFRLTRDIVDGMGFIGLEGVFKRCSEKTMEVMRNSHDVLLTILEVLLYDPLYDWSVPSTNSSSSSSSIKSGKTSSPRAISGQEVNKLAERALMRLQQKLQGLEEGMTLSVNGQVNMLTQQARDPNNLCRLYAGWQPYL